MRIPLTLLAGPSTTLRDDLVRCLVLRRPHCVAVVYELEPGPTSPRLRRRVVDAAGVHDSVPVDLVGCCLSCTLREDAVEAAALVAHAGRWSEVVLALPAPVTPGPVAQALHGRDDVAVDTVTTVVDALLLRAHLTGDDLLAERGLAAAPTDRRATAELVVAQVEDADVLAVAHLHRVATGAARTLEALLAHLAPLALQVPLGPGGAGVDDAVSTGRSGGHSGAPGASPGRAADAAADLAAALCPPTCGVTTVVWRSDRPLHPGRLHRALGRLVAGVVRSRGHVWLLDRPRVRLRWESAGGSISLGDGQRWRELPNCQLVLTGIGLDEARLLGRLDACLATDEEIAGGPPAEDPFAAALGPVERPLP
jgi:G3E family GTPase